MNLENIIIICVCLVVVATAGYFLWNKISNQNKTIDELNKKMESIELMFTRPSQDQLNSVFGQNQMYIQHQHQPRFARPTTSHQNHQFFEQQEQPQSRLKQNCNEINGLCELRPLIVEPNETIQGATNIKDVTEVIENHSEQESVRRRENAKTV